MSGATLISRGILIGGSVGILAALAGFSDSLPKSFGLGMAAGFLAGLTLSLRQNKKPAARMTEKHDEQD
ncbi:MAG: hypothetical protein PUB69_02680 [Desulfovibrionaceae bacterium]|nr:hypothetical protein [Desulfovibrionaceae bacterium]